MALLKSVNDVPGVDFYEHRDQLYYNKYEYRARFYLVGVRYTWYIKDNIQELVDKLNGPAIGYSYSYINGETNRDEIKENIPKLKKYLHWRNEIRKKKNSIIRVEHNTVAVFSNNLQELHDITNIIPDIEIDITQAQTANFVGVRYFVRKPKHSYRVYLKSRRVEGSFAEDLNELFKKNKKLYPCPALKHWARGSVNNNQVSWKYRFSSSIHFIDYDDESTLSYLAILYGDMLGKRYKLEKRPDPI